MANQEYETRLIMTVPSRGRIVIEGSSNFVEQFFNNVKIEYTNQMSAALKLSQAKGECELIEKTEGNTTTLELVEKPQAAAKR